MDKAPAAAEAAPMISLLDIAAAVAVLLVLALIFLFARKKMEDLRELEGGAANAEEEFASRMVQLLESRSAIPKEPLMEPPLPGPVPPPALPEGVSSPNTPPIAGAAANPVERLAQRLQALRIVTDYEGRVPLAVPPDGLIYRMRKGGTALLLPRQESDDTMRHLARRFDMVFVLTREEDDVLIVERLQTRLPQLLDSPTQMFRSS